MKRTRWLNCILMILVIGLVSNVFAETKHQFDITKYDKIAKKNIDRINNSIRDLSEQVKDELTKVKVQGTQKKSILVIHSYYEGLGWINSVTNGIESFFNYRGQEIEFFFEYMDTKRTFDERYLRSLFKLYQHKFNKRNFDVIITSDDHAFNFVLRHYHELFPDTPAVFCGVNFFKESKGESVLIVGDFKEPRELASEMLKKLGYSVTTVSSDEEAAEYMKYNSEDLLVLDMIIDPGIDGLITYKGMQELQPNQKAIIARGFAETDLEKETQIFGASKYIKKPYTLELIGLAVKIN